MRPFPASPKKSLKAHFIEIIESVVLYQRVTLYIPLTKEEIRQRLAQYSDRDWLVTPRSFWQSQCRYSLELDNYFFKLIGPFGNRKWRLLTQGEIQDAPGGAQLQLTQRLANFHAITLLCLLGFYLIAAWQMGFFPIMGSIVVLQVLFLYAVVVCVFKYEAEQILKLLLRTLLQ